MPNLIFKPPVLILSFGSLHFCFIVIYSAWSLAPPTCVTQMSEGVSSCWAPRGFVKAFHHWSAWSSRLSVTLLCRVPVTWLICMLLNAAVCMPAATQSTEVISQKWTPQSHSWSSFPLVTPQKTGIWKIFIHLLSIRVNLIESGISH